MDLCFLFSSFAYSYNRVNNVKFTKKEKTCADTVLADMPDVSLMSVIVTLRRHNYVVTLSSVSITLKAVWPPIDHFEILS